MASELEPEVPAIDQSLLECSAEETAGVSAGPGRDVRPSQAEPRGGTDSRKSRSGRLSGLPERGAAPTLPLHPQTARRLRCAPASSYVPPAQSQQLFTVPPPAPHEAPSISAVAPYARSGESGGKSLLGVGGVIAPLSAPGSAS